MYSTVLAVKAENVDTLGSRDCGDLCWRRRGNTITTFFIFFPGVIAEAEVQKISLKSWVFQIIEEDMVVNGFRNFTLFEIGQSILYRQISEIINS